MHALRSLDRVQREMDSAEGLTSQRPGRKSTAPIDFLVTNLNWIQNDATRDNVIRSNKKTEKTKGREFIRQCCKKVGLSEGQIDRALKRNISKFHNMLSRGVDLSGNPSSSWPHVSESKRARQRLKS